jgi:hypothetical protein
MNPDFDLSPAPLSYVAALRGIRPRRPGENFAYAEIVTGDPVRLVCLAASNSEGKFYGIAARAADKAEGERLAVVRQVDNVTFLEGHPSDFLARAEKGAAPFPPLNYLCCDERRTPLAASERAALFALAEKSLLPGGLLAYGYRAYDKDDGALRFLVREFAPEMNVSQAAEFLQELKKLGGFYFAQHPEVAAKLEQAIASNVPDQFFSGYDKGEAKSGSFDTIVALRPRGFTYAGDADIGKNYIERTAPVSAHQLIIDCQNNYLYEPIKDFALNRQERCDIWCRQPAPASENPAELFGGFVYGISRMRAEVPQQIKTESGPIDLSSPLYTKLIDLMTLIPVSIGDFLAHPDGKGFTPVEVVTAIQVLVACGLARPMRGHHRTMAASMAQPRLTGTFNQYLDKMPITGDRVWMASPVVGSAVAVSARDALVMQVLNRVGLADSVAALLPELERLAKDPASAARIMDAAVPTEEIATNMIKDTVSQSIVQWYAYGFLEAA